MNKPDENENVLRILGLLLEGKKVHSNGDEYKLDAYNHLCFEGTTYNVITQLQDPILIRVNLGDLSLSSFIFWAKEIF